MSLLLAIDVGNTHIVIGIYSGETLTASLRIHTDRQKTVDEYGIMFKSLIRDQGLALEDITAVAVSNVVPDLRSLLEELCGRYLKAPMLKISSELDLGIKLNIDRPSELGADLIAAAVAAHNRFAGPLVVVDLGTATTISALNDRGDFLGTAIAPGLIISADAVYQRAPHLPRIKFLPPSSPIGTNTIHSMQSGLLLGHACMVDGLIERMQEELVRNHSNGSSFSQVKVIATGGLAEVVAAACRHIDEVDPNLVLEGIRLLYLRNLAKVSP